ncbi:uracil permease [Stemphylium lycopersici]|uniref:Uracil permease n=1 Tax=Stemphylium lycopersici TaxID=183478 RepID=A0A364MWN2_STELY|nr:ncs1 allantoate transporter [Stemphylium lycopersici]RAR00100.1 uracil permease [Stemphylium lycopersici]RAR05767.1 uracil permease [Stemphylium lycopersici]
MPLIEKPHWTIKVEQPSSAFAEGNARCHESNSHTVQRHGNSHPASSQSVLYPSISPQPSIHHSNTSAPLGLTWRESLGIVALAFFIISFVIALNGAIGVLHHVPFPVIARASWGFWGSYVAIVSRAVLAVFWFAIQNMNGANAVRVMLGAIWPSFLTLENGIPESQGIDTATMISFFLFWLGSIPFLVMHPNQLRWLFMAKSIIVPIAWIAILIWAFSDFSRYSRVSVKWQCIYVPFLPIVFTFIAFIGVAATSAGAVQYGEINWDPMALISHWDNRACRFFAAFSFALAALGVNISANSLSAANDLTALFPQYINIRRGQLLCAVLCWALVPWKILASAGSFLNFMAAYAIFLGPIAAIMVMDFWVVHRAKYDTLALYQYHGIYRYTAGCNWRAIVAFLVGVAPNMPGFIQSINPDIDAGVGARPYSFGWLLGFVATTLVYLLLEMVVAPPTETFIERAVYPDEIYDENGTVDEGRYIMASWCAPIINQTRVSTHTPAPQRNHSPCHLKPYSPTASPKTAAAAAAAATATAPKPTCTLPPAPVLSSALASALAAATCNPYAVDVAAVPLIVVVTTLVAVVLAVQPAQLVHGGELLHGPAVQPGQSEAGHLLPSHHAVQGPSRQSERVAQSL